MAESKGFGLNTGQYFTLASGAMGVMGNYIKSRYDAKALKAQAAAYEAQIPSNYAAYREQIEYMGEQNLYNVNEIRQQYDALFGEQVAQLGASGFDVSSGDERILADTESKKKDAIYLQNRSAYLQSFELWKDTMMENSRLEAAAKSSRAEAKYMKKMAKYDILSGILNTGAKVYGLSTGKYMNKYGE